MCTFIGIGSVKVYVNDTVTMFTCVPAIPVTVGVPVLGLAELQRADAPLPLWVKKQWVFEVVHGTTEHHFASSMIC
jgi:hypothetical protein